jgi:anti-sigma B factor antagonist
MRLRGDPPPGRTAVVALPAEIDINNSGEVHRLLRVALTSGADLLIVDLSGTTYCDVSAVRAIMQARAETTGTELRLVVPPGPVRRLLDLISLDGQLAVYSTPGQASNGGPER